MKGENGEGVSGKGVRVRGLVGRGRWRLLGRGSGEVACEAVVPPGANRWPHGDATYLLNPTGVGTKNPQEQLHVNGTARVDGALQLRAAANSPVPATISADAAGRVLLSVPARGGISMGSYGTP